jgi:hypothetical protein
MSHAQENAPHSSLVRTTTSRDIIGDLLPSLHPSHPAIMAQDGDITLHISLNGSYHPVLSIPPHDFGHFSTHPLKWLRYLAYTIYGREGFISTSANGEEIQDYNLPLQHAHYFFCCDGKLELSVLPEWPVYH